MAQTILGDWQVAMEQQLQSANPTAAAALAQVVLKRLPRHLSTYQRLLQATWLLQRWDEGEEWAKRLLRADPRNAMAWRALAMAAEQRGQRAQAHATWQRALEAAPYEPTIRAGLSRTTLRPTSGQVGFAGEEPAVVLNLACLATLYLYGLRWEQAAATYQMLLQAEPRRVDFQLGRLAALWQQRARQAAYRLARQLTAQHSHLLIAWAALHALGDEDDRALARSPIEMLDPDGDFVSSWFGIPYESQPVVLDVSTTEAALLQTFLKE
ncbi:MAG: bacterial transcriptional activator domain-containing protein [Caldilineaceae bacterium]